jgi:hypothetical protein
MSRWNCGGQTNDPLRGKDEDAGIAATIPAFRTSVFKFGFSKVVFSNLDFQRLNEHFQFGL